MPPDLEDVRAAWEAETCGTRYGSSPEDRRNYFQEIESTRYHLEPYIKPFARFDESRGLRVLEVGVGAGTDFVNWCRAGARPTGVDLTKRSIELTRERLDLEGFKEGEDFELRLANAEALPFSNGHFDLVYSWGVLHHTPNTPSAFAEANRVLRPGGDLRAMIYHPHSWTAVMLWARYALLRGKPAIGLRQVVFEHLESPGTKTYTEGEARSMLESTGFRDISFQRVLSCGDLLLIAPSHKHRGHLFSLAKACYPRRFIRTIGPRMGLNLMVSAVKRPSPALI